MEVVGGGLLVVTMIRALNSLVVAASRRGERVRLARTTQVVVARIGERTRKLGIGDDWFLVV